MKYCILLTAALLAGCADWPKECEDPYVLKEEGKAYGKVIRDPYKWISRQFEESCPVTYEVADGIKRVKLQEAVADLDHDSKPELFLGNSQAGYRVAAVFTRVMGGYRYVGGISGSAFRIIEKNGEGRPCILVLEPCGGHLCYVKTYVHNGVKFECTGSEELVCGDGAPEENNRRLDELFFSDSAKDSCLKWRKHSWGR